MKELRVGIVGHKFMGKAHSNAWKRAPEFFDMEAKPVLQVACGRNEAKLTEFARCARAGNAPKPTGKKWWTPMMST